MRLAAISAAFLLALASAANLCAQGNVGTVTQTIQQLGVTNNYIFTFRWTASVSGTVPVTPGAIPNLQGWRISQVETSPGSPAPTGGYSVQLLDSFGGDMMTGNLSSLSASQVQFFQGPVAAPPLIGTFSLSLSGNSVSGAQGTVSVYLTLVNVVNVGTQGPQGSIGPTGATGATGPSGPAGSAAPLLNAALYNFAPQTPGGTITGGVNFAMTMTPVPLGVNGTDSNHWLYVSGGTGTAESCLIVGGTGTAGQPSGQIIISCANNHSGAWTVESTAGGIPEGVQVANAAGGGTVSFTGSITTQAEIFLPSKVNLQGSGRGSATILAANLSATTPWAAPGYAGLYAVVVTNNTSDVSISHLTIDATGSSAGEFNLVSIVNSPYFREQDTELKGLANGSTGAHEYIFVGGTSNNSLISGNWMIGISSSCGGSSVAPGGVSAPAPNLQVIANTAIDLCNSSFGVGNGGLIQGNVALSATNEPNGAQIIIADSESNITIDSNYCDGGGASSGTLCFATVTDVPTTPATNVRFTNNTATNCGTGFWAGGVSTAPSSDLQFANNTAFGCQFGAQVNTYSNHVAFIGGDYSNNSVDGINVASSTASTITDLRFVAVRADHNGTNSGSNFGLIFNEVGGGVLATDVLVSDSIFSDSATSKVQAGGIGVNTGTTVNNFQVSDNLMYGNSAAAWSGTLPGTFGPNTTDDTYNGIVLVTPKTFASIIGCAAGTAGAIARVSDSTTNTWGATITGSGSDPVLAYCDGTNWTVAGK